MNTSELSVNEKKKFQDFLASETKEKERKERLEYLRDHLQWVKIVFIFNTICFIICLALAIYRWQNGKSFEIFVIIAVFFNSILYVYIGLGFYLTKKEIKVLEKSKLKP